MSNHDHVWRVLRCKRFYQYDTWYGECHYWTYVYKSCMVPGCTETERERKVGYWYDSDFVPPKDTDVQD